MLTYCELTWFTVYSNIFKVTTIRVPPGFRHTVQKAGFHTITNNVIQPDRSSTGTIGSKWVINRNVSKNTKKYVSISSSFQYHLFRLQLQSLMVGIITEKHSAGPSISHKTACAPSEHSDQPCRLASHHENMPI